METSTVTLHVAKSVAPVVTDIIASEVYPAGKRTVLVSQWQEGLYDVLFGAAEALNAIEQTQGERIRNYLAEQYGEDAPTYAQFISDRAALHVIALDRGLVDDQYVRKLYNKAIKELFGELPVSMSPEAIAKRAQRPAKHDRVTQKAVAKIVSNADQIEAFIASVGMARILTTAAKILKASQATKLDGATIDAIASHFSQKVA